MNCNEAYILFNLFIDKEINSSEEELLQLHINECSNCKKSFDELQDINSLLTEEEVEIPFDLTDYVMSKISNYAINIQYEENKKLKLIILLETIGVLAIGFLAIPNVFNNIQTLSSSINQYTSNFNNLNGSIYAYIIQLINNFEAMKLTNIPIMTYVMILLACLVFNFIIINKLRRQKT